MDPNATLREIAEALKSDDRELARKARTDLIAWIRKGGFQPDWTIVNQQTRDFVCASVEPWA